MSDWVLTSSVANKANNKVQPKPKSDWVLTEPKEEESFLQKLPRNVGIGLANLGHSTLNAPHDITQAFEGATKGFGGANAFLQIPPNIENSINRKQLPEISKYIPQQQEYDYAKMLGQEGEPTFADTLVQKGVEYAPEALIGMNALRKLTPLTKWGATKKLNKAQKLAAEREIGKLNVDPELIEDARQFLPDLLQNRNELNASHAGDYKSLFDLQSNVGKISAARKGKLSKIFAPETHLKGKAGLESRRSLINALQENLDTLGHKDISDLMRQGQNDYRKYMNYRKYRNIIGTGAAAYLAPKNSLIDLFKKLWHA